MRVVLLSGQVKIPKTNQKANSFPIKVSQVLMPGYEAPSGGEKNTSDVSDDEIGVKRCFKKACLRASEPGPTPPGAVRVASRTPGQFESLRADKRICLNNFETSGVFFSRVC